MNARRVLTSSTALWLVVCAYSLCVIHQPCVAQEKKTFFGRLFGKKTPVKPSLPVDDGVQSVMSVLEIKALDKAAQLALQRPDPRQWDATLFIPGSKLAELTKAAFKGVAIETSVTSLPNLRLAITDVKVKSEYGTGEIDLMLTAGTTGGIELAKLHGSAALVYHSYSIERESGDATVRLALAIRSLGVTDGSQAGAWLEDLIGDGFTTLFADRLCLDIPMPGRFKLDTDYNKVHPLKTEGGRATGLVQVRVKTEKTVIVADARMAAALFVPAGLWLTASMKDIPDSEIAIPPGATLSSLMSNYQKMASRHPSLFLRSGALVDFINNDVGKIDSKFRTGFASIDGHSGEIYYKPMRDKVLGNGGVKVSLANNDATGSLALDPITATWSDKGLRAEAGYKFEVKDAALAVHVDPCVTGGITSNVGCKASTESGILRGTVDVAIIKGDHDAVGIALRPVFDNQEIELKLRTDGRFKLASIKLEAFGGWTKIPGIDISVPEFGVNTRFGLGPESLPGFTLLTNAPRKLVVTDDKEKAGKKRYRVNLPWTEQYLVVTPKKAQASKLGYEVECDVELTVLEDQSAASRILEVAAALSDKNKAVLPEAGGIEVVLGDLEFGHNNDLVKLLRQIVEAFDNTYKTAKKAGKDVERELNVAYKKLETVIGKSADEIGKAADAIITNPGQAVEDFVHQRKKDINKILPFGWSL